MKTAKRKPREASQHRINIDARRVRFVQEYLIDSNGTQAAIRAGYAANSARQTATRLLSDTAIADRIEAGKADIAERNRLKLDDIVQELRKVGFANIQDYTRVAGDDGLLVPDFSAVTRDQLAAVHGFDVTEDIIDSGTDRADRQRVDGDDGFGEPRTTVLRRKVKFRLHDKVNALIQLGRHLGGFGATLNVTQNVNVNVQTTRDELRKLPPAAIDAIIDGVSEVVERGPGEGEADSPDGEG